MYIVFSSLFALVLISCLSIIQAKSVRAFGEIDEGKTRAESLVIPFLQEYSLEEGGRAWKLKREGQELILGDLVHFNVKKLKNICEIVSGDFLDWGLINTPLEILVEEELEVNKQAIYLAYTNDFEGVKNPDQAYKISIGNKGLTVRAKTELGIFYGLRSIENILLINKEIPYGQILDYPELEERRLHVDMGRKYISKDWLIKLIREMSHIKLNALQLHFSENYGFRLESEYDPKILSKDYIRKEEIKSVIEEADRHFIKIIPSLDSPGHVDQILKAYPQYGQVDIDGKHSKSGLDVTNPEAIEYIKGLYSEYMDLFASSTDFHIGGDEYMEFDRPPFTTKYKKVLDDYAKERLGESYGWKDVLASYINEIGEFVYERGFKPRVWNDGLYYGEEDENEPVQKMKIHEYIGIDYWSKMPWNPAVASLQALIDRGHKRFYNVNSGFFYYVLRPESPNDGRKQHSFDFPNQDRRIYEKWTAGKFADNEIDDRSPLIKGVAMAIWSDQADIASEETIMKDIENELRAMACKSWNTRSDKLETYEKFYRTCQKLKSIKAISPRENK